MTLQIGRVTGLRPEPGWSRAGNTLTFSGTFKTEQYRDPAEIDVRRMQVQNLPDNPDEEFYPVLYAGDPSINGYYRVLASSVTALGTIRNGSGRWSITLERHPEGVNARSETTYMSTIRANGHSITSVGGLVIAGTPDDDQIDSEPEAGASYPTATGKVAEFIRAQDVPARGSVQSSVDPAAYYQGACLVEQKIGDTWWPVVGHLPVGKLTVWRISNGMIRVTGDSIGVLKVEGFDPGAEVWDTQRSFATAPDASSATRNNQLLTAPAQDDTDRQPEMVILTNDVDNVVVRYVNQYRRTWTFAVRRAVPIVYCSLVSLEPIPLTSDGYHAIGFATDTTTVQLSTPATLGIEAAQASGNFYAVMAAQAATANNTRGKIILNAASTSILFGIGYRDNAFLTATGLRNQFIGAVWSKTRMVVR